MLLLLLGGVGFEVMPGKSDNLVAFSIIKKLLTAVSLLCLVAPKLAQFSRRDLPARLRRSCNGSMRRVLHDIHNERDSPTLVDT